MIASSPYAFAFFGLLPVAAGASLTLRGSMLLTLGGRLAVLCALALDALTITSFILSARPSA